MFITVAPATPLRIKQQKMDGWTDGWTLVCVNKMLTQHFGFFWWLILARGDHMGPELNFLIKRKNLIPQYDSNKLRMRHEIG